MRTSIIRRMVMALLLGVLASPAAAEVESVDANGFVVAISREAQLPPHQLWAQLQNPAAWWSDAHTWSGDADNMRMDARVGGCWCERVGEGEVEHGRIIRIDAGRAIIMAADLGPLSGAAVSARLRWSVDSSRVTMRYAVFGRLPMPADQLAPLVDQVLTQQLERLAALTAG